MNLDVLMTFLDFVTERHRIWEQRQAGKPQPWTEDEILASHKFTNVFRVLDPGSQFVFELAPPDDDPFDVIARLFLYRHTNLPAVWRAFAADAGSYPTVDELGDFLDFCREYKERGGQLFSGAYMVFPQSTVPGTEKIVSVVDLTLRLYREGTFQDVINARTLRDRFRALRVNKGVADFMSMQITTDWGYTAQCGQDLENEFVVAGPGSKRGAALLERRGKPEETIAWAQKVLHQEEGLQLPSGRLPSLMDVQNCFCEFSKYAKRKPGRPYKPAHPGRQPEPRLPEHWSCA